MYRRILVPVDGSAASMTGLKHALGLAKDQHARLRVLNVVDDMIIAPMMIDAAGAIDYTQVIDSLRAEGGKVLKNAAALAGKSGIKAETVQVESRGQRVSEVILADARRSRADVIVMGTHGRRGLNRLLLGSDAERVLREAPVPVLLTRREIAKRGSPKRTTAR
jgi:nucleotide-binding universal stress UspA family protein